MNPTVSVNAGLEPIRWSPHPPGVEVDVTPGLWDTGGDEGMVFVSNLGHQDQTLLPGATVAAVGRQS